MIYTRRFLYQGDNENLALMDVKSELESRGLNVKSIECTGKKSVTDDSWPDDYIFDVAAEIESDNKESLEEQLDGIRFATYRKEYVDTEALKVFGKVNIMPDENEIGEVLYLIKRHMNAGRSSKEAFMEAFYSVVAVPKNEVAEAWNQV